MSDLFWPGSERAGDAFSDTAYLAAMIRVEEAWLTVVGRPRPLGDLVGPSDLTVLARDAEREGNPVPALVRLLRERSGEDLLHRGLTSQDVVDSAMVLLLRDVVDRVLGQLREQVESLDGLAHAHRRTMMSGRTLTQHAVPTTFGLKAAVWLTGVLDAWDDLVGLEFPVQLGGAAGTMAAAVELGLDAASARADLAAALGLRPTAPWHTTRRSITRAGDALVACTDAWGRVANDVLTLTRPEVAEVSEGAGGGSSTMPHKQNPVLSVLLRRAALTTPQLAATLHAAAADQADERAVGGWHAEWPTLQALARRVLVGAGQASDLVGGLRVDGARMRITAEASAADLHAEQRAMAVAAGHEPGGDYLGAAEVLIDEARTRAVNVLSSRPDPARNR